MIMRVADMRVLLERHEETLQADRARRFLQRTFEPALDRLLRREIELRTDIEGAKHWGGAVGIKAMELADVENEIMALRFKDLPPR